MAQCSSDHPRTLEIVESAIWCLKEQGGSSFQPIKKYIATNIKVDSDKLSPAIYKSLKAAVASGELVQTKGPRREPKEGAAKIKVSVTDSKCRLQWPPNYVI